MERRDLLKLGALAGATGLTGLGGSSCLLPRILFDNDPLALPDMDVFLAALDHGVDHIEGWSPAAGDAEGGESNRPVDRLSRKALKTLFLTAMFSDLPPEGQMHPGMQERIRRATPDIDEAVFGMTERVRSRTPDEWKATQAVLRGPTNPGMLVADKIDRHAAACALPMRRRLQTRAMFAHVDGRLRKQPPGLLVDEIVTKVDKLRERGGSPEEFQQKMSSRIGEQAFQEHQQRLAAYVQQWEARGVPSLGAKSVDGGPEPEATDGGTVDDSVSPQAEPPAAESDSSSRTLTAGLIIMGIGSVVLLASGIAFATASAYLIPAAIAMTVGGVILLIGLIVTIVGAAT